MQVAVRLGREARHDFGVLARLEVVVNDLADEVPRFVVCHGGGLYAILIRVQLRAVIIFRRNTSIMPKYSLPDGSDRQFDTATSGAEIAASIGEGLARAAVAIRVDGELWDLNRDIEADAAVEIVTRDSDDGVELLRHDAAHVLAEAVKELWPETQVTIGPAIENGFYYDFSREGTVHGCRSRNNRNRMKDIVDRDESIEREVWERDKAAEFFRGIGEEYKAEIIESIPSEEDLTLYRQGEFIDLCRGPHLPSTGKLGKAFKLTHVSGAYWRGDSNNEMLQRIYGTAWSNDKALRKYLHMLEEAEKRDHRRLGRVMDLFHFQEEAPGAVFWHPNGWAVFQSLIGYMRQKQNEAGYQEINTPEIMAKALWEKSGHNAAFGDNMFTSETVDGRVYAVKPMNCPGHVQVFKQGITSYRDLPVRLAEFGKCHRYEPSGALHGMMRVRAFTQDDAHIFCTPEQITDESIAVCKLILEIYRGFGFARRTHQVRRSTGNSRWRRRNLGPGGAGAAQGTRSRWSRLHTQPGRRRFLRSQARVRPARCHRPRLAVRHVAGRSQHAGPPRGDLYRRGRQQARTRHVASSDIRFARALHGHSDRAPCRQLATVAGAAQVKVLTITSDADDYANEIVAELRAAGLRADCDLRNEKISYKVREHSVAKVPALFAVGQRELENRTVAVRRLGSKKQQVMPLDEAIEALRTEVDPA